VERARCFAWQACFVLALRIAEGDSDVLVDRAEKI